MRRQTFIHGLIAGAATLSLSGLIQAQTRWKCRSITPWPWAVPSPR